MIMTMCTCIRSTFIPRIVPWINGTFHRLFSRRRVTVDRSDRVFNFNCLFRQYVMEWAVPRLVYCATTRDPQRASSITFLTTWTNSKWRGLRLNWTDFISIECRKMYIGVFREWSFVLRAWYLWILNWKERYRRYWRRRNRREYKDMWGWEAQFYADPLGGVNPPGSSWHPMMWLWCRPPLGGVNPRDSSWHPLMWKISKIVVTRCHNLRLKCTKFNFGWDSTPDPAGWAYSTPPDPLAEFKGPTSKEREGRAGEGRGGKGKGGHPLVLAYTPPPDVKSWIKPCLHHIAAC